jgi:hypothetical protein
VTVLFFTAETTPFRFYSNSGTRPSGGCVAHKDVYEKIFKQDDDAASYFLRVLNESLEVRLRNIGIPAETLVYTNAEIPPEFLKSKADETKVEEFAKQAPAALRTTYLKKHSPESERLQLPESTRFMLFRREGDSFREIVEYMVGQQVTFKTEVAITIEEGVCPIAEAVLTRDTVLVLYTCRYDECDESDPENEYWRQTLERFPKARIDSLRKLAMHPASIMAIPLDPLQADRISAVAVFDCPEKSIFNKAIAEEMAITLRVLYGQLFGSQEIEGPGILEL